MGERKHKDTLNTPSATAKRMGDAISAALEAGPEEAMKRKDTPSAVARRIVTGFVFGGPRYCAKVERAIARALKAAEERGYKRGMAGGDRRTPARDALRGGRMTKRERDEARRLCEAAPSHDGETWFRAEWAEAQFYEAARTALPAALDALDECINLLNRARYPLAFSDQALYEEVKKALRKLSELPEEE